MGTELGEKFATQINNKLSLTSLVQNQVAIFTQYNLRAKPTKSNKTSNEIVSSSRGLRVKRKLKLAHFNWNLMLTSDQPIRVNPYQATT